ncbi:MAG: hypothetical protein ACK419_02965 [Pyrinomonadaceae bacterium]
MFEVASKKLGLEAVILGKKPEEANTEEIIKGMSKDEIEKVTKF